MKRSRAVPLTLVASAASLAACGPRETMQCIDRSTGRAAPESLCVATNAPTTRGPAGDSVRTQRAGGVGIAPIFLWYYGGRMVNGMLSGGSYAPLPGRRYQSPGGYRWSRDGVLSSPRGGAYAGARPGSGTQTGFGRSTPTARGGFGRIGGGRIGGG